MKALRCILWAGFLHESPDLTEQQVGNLIDVAYMQELVGSLNLALEQDLSPKEEGDATPESNGDKDPNA